MNMQQQPMSSMGAPPSTVTTEQIQKMLDENKQLILAILENQNKGKLAECAKYQAQLQKNLLYLAAIADAQPPGPTARPQMAPHAIPQQQPGGHYMQPPPFFHPRPSLQFGAQQQLQQHLQSQLHQHQQQPVPFQGPMGLSPAAINGMHPMPADVGGSSEIPSAVEGRGGKQDPVGNAEATAAEGLVRNSGTVNAHENPESSHSRRPDDKKTP